MDDRRPGIDIRIVIWLEPGVVPTPTPAGPVKRDGYALMGAFALAFPTPTCMKDHESVEAGRAQMEDEFN